MAEERQIFHSWMFHQNAAGVWVPVTPTSPLPVTHVLGNPPYSAQCLDITIPAGTTYLVSSGDVWGVLALVVEAGAELRIDGEVHCWDDVTGAGIITGDGDLRLH